MTKQYKKVPKAILIACPDIKYFPTEIMSEVDYSPEDKRYDLVICTGKTFKIKTEYPLSIAESEIYFERGTALTEELFNKALEHYSECEIRNGI